LLKNIACLASRTSSRTTRLLGRKKCGGVCHRDGKVLFLGMTVLPKERAADDHIGRRRWAARMVYTAVKSAAVSPDV
jgi:hypothetical protein